MADPEDQPAYTAELHEALAPIADLEDDAMLCVGFAIAAEHRIERELAAMTVEERGRLMVKYCKVCETSYRWQTVLTPFYEQAHRYRFHPDFVCTFETLGLVP